MVTSTTSSLPPVWGLIILAALMSGLIFGLLTHLHTKGNWPVALLAAFTAAGATTMGVHQLISM